MNVSMNEVESMAKTAARGAGYSWGLAEEAGKATRWLSPFAHKVFHAWPQTMPAGDRDPCEPVYPGSN